MLGGNNMFSWEEKSSNSYRRKKMLEEREKEKQNLTPEQREKWAEMRKHAEREGGFMRASIIGPPIEKRRYDSQTSKNDNEVEDENNDTFNW